MDSLVDYELEYYEKYFGDAQMVISQVEVCPKCGSKFFFTHQTDRSNGYVKETASCTQCDYGQRKLLSTLN